MMASHREPLLNELGKRDGEHPETDVERKKLPLPDLTEREVMKHFIHLSQMNYGIDCGFYPLGSCTMKYNMKLLERVVKNERVAQVHPLQDESTVQGCLHILHHLEQMLCEITGMDAFSLQPCAGAHGEFTGMLMTRAYFEQRGEHRTEVIVPDSAHGTNPASAKMAGFDVVEIPSRDGMVDMDALEHALSEQTAAFMLTNPNTLGIFEKDIQLIARKVREAGALLYYDGANLNAIMGKTSPGVMGFDIVHVNLHKTFGTPHGGGGPGAGPVGVREHLEEFLPIPRVVRQGEGYALDYERPRSIGKMSMFYGNFAVLLRAYAYILRKGNSLQEVSERAVVNANYLMERLRSVGYDVPFYRRRMHEFVLSLASLKKRGVRALDVAKRLLDYGFHPPTIYFPLIVEEAFMVEPTEDEGRETLDSFVNAMETIVHEDENIVRGAPHRMPVKRVNEGEAVRNAILTWKDL